MEALCERHNLSTLKRKSAYVAATRRILPGEVARGKRCPRLGCKKTAMWIVTYIADLDLELKAKSINRDSPTESHGKAEGDRSEESSVLDGQVSADRGPRNDNQGEGSPADSRAAPKA